MKRFATFFVVLGSMVLVSGIAVVSCSDSEPATAPTNLMHSSLPRATPSLPPGDLAQQIQGNNQLGIDLYHKLRKDGANYVVSPHSITSAFAMLYGGARGQTARDMRTALHYLLPDERLHPVFNSLDRALGSRGVGAKGADGKPFRLRVVNDFWGARQIAFLPSYLDLLATHYGAGIHVMDFLGNPDGERVVINDWIAKQTEDRIKDLLPRGSITDSTGMVLTNAIYFNAAWKNEFTAELTTQKSFDADGSPVTVDMMQRTAKFSYYKGTGFQSVELPYEKDELSMVVLVPDAGTFRAFQKGLTLKTVDDAVAGLQSAEVALALPRFEFRKKEELADALKALGLGSIFENTDFSGIDGGAARMQVQRVIHEAFIKVNEQGAEAAAATAITMDAGMSAPPPEPIRLTVDRPFIFAIRDRATQAILFIGHVVDPSAKTP